MRRNKLSKRKLNFARYYFDLKGVYPQSQPSNAYRCAMQVGYSESYAKKIMSYMNWMELALMAENQGLVLLNEKSRKYALKYQKRLHKVEI